MANHLNQFVSPMMKKPNQFCYRQSTADRNALRWPHLSRRYGIVILFVKLGIHLHESLVIQLSV